MVVSGSTNQVWTKITIRSNAWSFAIQIQIQAVCKRMCCSKISFCPFRLLHWVCNTRMVEFFSRIFAACFLSKFYLFQTFLSRFQRSNCALSFLVFPYLPSPWICVNLPIPTFYCIIFYYWLPALKCNMGKLCHSGSKIIMNLKLKLADVFA